MRLFFALMVTVFAIIGCTPPEKKIDKQASMQLPSIFLVVLGVAQDAGYPQIGCEKAVAKPIGKVKKVKSTPPAWH
ncbi:hypothetical protein [Paraflavitalea speifideaquila]|uniref:hypothetical protein n=1 Tax=Paraflavitalea speifideaquila TaxID=3076558 RepID=UPI0028E97F94|nr:hypothetical protein [Paraflavitalea speifideiaquila]